MNETITIPEPCNEPVRGYENLREAEVDLGDRPDLLGAIMKSPGPFLQFPDGRFLANDASLDEAAYLAILDGVPVYEASGAVDFDALVLRLHDLMR